MRTDTLQPLRLYLRQGARKQTRGFNQFSCNNPSPRFLAQRGARPKMKLDTPRAKVMRLILLLETNIPEQAGEQRKMQLLVGGR